ncbi:tRNA-dihydrouridine(47) synthase [NAD(P)(+)]-like [Nymphaea colorata]|nr:tRNA-dihydrouridine(47) synthase [NAD(P)(+)]-like [Nymphaea colorata]
MEVAGESLVDGEKLDAMHYLPAVREAPTPEELVARAIAPVNREFLCAAPQRSAARREKPDEEVHEKNGVPVVAKEKKSKRQLKRERQLERESALHICSEVAKTGNSKACKYEGNCRFSHDVEAYMAQKPKDLAGDCPFLDYEEPCPYGITCRFAGSHKDVCTTESLGTHQRMSERNGLNKDVQKLLWKNKVSFPKADLQLKMLGLSGKGNSKTRGLEEKKVDDTSSISDCTYVLKNDESSDKISNSLNDGVSEHVLEKDYSDEIIATDECRPSKMSKILLDEAYSVNNLDNGSASIQKDSEDTSTNAEKLNVSGADDLHLLENDADLKSNHREKKLIDFREKLYLAPLTTVGNLPFRRVCKALGADITCGEMAMCTNLLQGQASEWALMRRHSSENLFGVQICGAYPDTVARTVELIDRECSVDFIDINMGCPIDIVVSKGAGSVLLTKPMRMKNIIEAASKTLDKPITIKVRTGYFEGRNRIDSLVADLSRWGASAVTIHGRSRQQRYSKLADWDYIYKCAEKTSDHLQVLGNGDVFSYTDWNKHLLDCRKLSACMIARGALIKPWIFTEIKEQRHWDISSGERFNILKDFVHFGLEHWGSDSKGVETTRYFLLEWLSYTYRYIPVALLDVVPQKLNWRPPSYFGRDDLETLLSSDSAADWIRISEMLLGPVPSGFSFTPKHKSNAYDKAENG